MDRLKGTCTQENRPLLLTFAQTYRCKRCGLTSEQPSDLCEPEAEFKA